MKKLLKLIAIVIATAMNFVGAPAMAAGEKLVFIYHSGDEDFWWNTIKNTINQLESEMDITVDIRNPPTGDSAGHCQSKLA
jgi:simple sugar transport system substrate-binding protein